MIPHSPTFYRNILSKYWSQGLLGIFIFRKCIRLRHSKEKVGYVRIWIWERCICRRPHINPGCIAVKKTLPAQLLNLYNGQNNII